jgi:hypothetical protein
VEPAAFVRSAWLALAWGKRGGARLIYIVRGEAFPIFFITVYAKNEKENLTQEQRNQLAKRADEIFTKYGK